jgi:hypothetical protein
MEGFNIKRLLISVTSFLLLAAAGVEAKSADVAMTPEQTRSENNASLEIRLTAPLRWEKGCLLIGLDRINHSSEPMYLTRMGPYFDLALDVSMVAGSKGEQVEWVNVYGVSDLVTFDAIPLAAGATLHTDFCFNPTIPVVNFKRETRRVIPLRGRMQIGVSYFPNEVSWKRNLQWHHDPPAPLAPNEQTGPPPDDLAPLWVRITVAIPCSDATCKSACAAPPIGFPGEVREVPDVSRLTPEWNVRGQKVTEELADKSPSCRSSN